MRTSRAVVQTAPRRLELRELPVPTSTTTARFSASRRAASAERRGAVRRRPSVRLPVVPGHEPLGVIERIGDRAGEALERERRRSRRRRVDHPLRPLPGLYRGPLPALPRARRALRARLRALDRPPGLWGAYADYMYLDPLSIVHRVRKDIPAGLAVMFNPLGAGFRWAVEIPPPGRATACSCSAPGSAGSRASSPRARRAPTRSS